MVEAAGEMQNGQIQSHITADTPVFTVLAVAAADMVSTTRPQPHPADQDTRASSISEYRHKEGKK